MKKSAFLVSLLGYRITTVKMNTKSNTLMVAVGVIQNHRQEIFLCRRHAKQHQGDKWEFPGGKVEATESVTTALARELAEEVGIEVLSSQPFLCLEHDYGDKKVRLDIYLVNDFSGEPHGREGQTSRWVPISELHHYDFPAANGPIVEKLQKIQRSKTFLPQNPQKNTDKNQLAKN